MISLLFNSATLLLNANVAVCEAPFAPHMRDRAAAPSFAGAPGLFEAPAAVSAPDRSTSLAVNNAWVIRDPFDPAVRIDRAQRSAFVGFGFFPRLALIARGAWTQGPWGGDAVRDISVNAHLLVAREGAWTPALAIGAQDFGGSNPVFTSEYAVASKSVLNRARLSVGYGSRGYTLKNFFGGVELSPCSWITGIAEKLTDHSNYGVRLSPLGSWGARKGIEPTFDILWREGQGRTYGAGLRIQAGSPARDEVKPTPAASRPVAPLPSPAQNAATQTLSAALVAHGFENVRTALTGDTIALAYENRVYNRDEWDALGIVMAEASRFAGPAHVMRVTLLRVGLPVLQVESGIPAFRNFVSGSANRTAFASQLVITNHASSLGGTASNSSRFRIDLTAQPRIDQVILTQAGAYEAELSIVPEASMQLGSGIWLSGRRAVVVHTTDNFIAGLRYPNVDQILFHVARSGLPFAHSASGLISHLSVGQFGSGKNGIAGEFDHVIAGGRVSVGGVAGAFRESASGPTGSVAYGSIRWRQAPLDLALSITAGRFAKGDVGATGEIERRFGLSEVAFFAQHTDFGATMAGVRVSIPLTENRDPRPRAIRLRLPDYGGISHMTQIAKKNVTRRDVAVPLETGGGMAKLFRGRDRLNSVRLIRELESLRTAALGCGCI